MNRGGIASSTPMSSSTTSTTADKRKHRIAEGIVRDALAGGRACISFQVVQECRTMALRKAAVPLRTDQARTYLDVVPAAPDAGQPSAAL